MSDAAGYLAGWLVSQYTCFHGKLETDGALLVILHAMAI